MRLRLITDTTTCSVCMMQRKKVYRKKKDLRMEKKDGNGCLTAVVGSCDGSKMRCY